MTEALQMLVRGRTFRNDRRQTNRSGVVLDIRNDSGEGTTTQSCTSPKNSSHRLSFGFFGDVFVYVVGGTDGTTKSVTACKICRKP